MLGDENGWDLAEIYQKLRDRYPPEVVGRMTLDEIDLAFNETPPAKPWVQQFGTIEDAVKAIQDVYDA